MLLNEDETKAQLITPALHAAGWTEEFIRRERYFTDGRIYLIADRPRRKERKRYDYMLCYASVVPLAVVEAKEESTGPGDGMQQAKEYAVALGVPFAYSTNGHGIEEFDFSTNHQQTVERFPSPAELWERCQSAQKGNGGRVAEAKAAYGGKSPLLHPYHHEPGGKVVRYYQEIAVCRVIEAILRRQKRILLTMATGTGKTLVAFQIVWKLMKSGHLRRVLYLADRNILRDQAYNTFAPFEDARALIEEGKAPTTRDIYFSIYQAMYGGDEDNRLYQRYPRDFFDLVIIDECHRSGFGRWHEILQHFSGAVHLGMTATPKRDDNIDTYAYFGEPVYTYSLGQGIDDGFLATYKIHKVFTNIDRQGGLHLDDARTQGAEIFCPEEADPKDFYAVEEFEREITLPDRTRKICDHLAGLLRTFGPTQKSMVFCVDMEHANDVAKQLQNHFSNLGYHDYAVRIVSEEPDARVLLERFADSDKPAPVVATTVDLLTTGVDVPSAKNIVFIRPVSSRVIFKQIVGRGSRIDPNTDKYFFRIIDYVNATRLFDDWDRPPEPPPERRPEGPRDRFLAGVVLDEVAGEPVAEALVTVLAAPNEEVHHRCGADGAFTFSGLPQGSVKVYVSATGYRSRELTVETFENPSDSLAIELKRERPAAGKISVKGLDVYIAEETYLELEATGQRLSVNEYVEYSKGEVVKRAASIHDLRDIWIDPSKRGTFLEELREQSVHPEVLAKLIERPDADTFDVLASLAFAAPVISRDERAKAVENLGQQFLSAFGPDAREVLLALLEKYRLAGVDELRPEVFRIPPFDRMGYAAGVTARFGDPERLRTAMDRLQKEIYLAEVVA